MRQKAAIRKSKKISEPQKGRMLVTRPTQASRGIYRDGDSVYDSQTEDENDVRVKENDIIVQEYDSGILKS